MKALEIVRNLPSVSRFDMVVLFLGDNEKKILKRVFDALIQRFPSKSDEMKKMKETYGL